MKKRLGVMLVALFLVCSFNIGAVNAESVDQSNVVVNDVNNVKNVDLNEFFLENDVPADKQEILLKKVQNNELWDAYKPEEIAKIPQGYFVFDPAAPAQTTYYRFEDGSFVSVGFEPPTNNLKSGDFTTFGVTPDTHGTRYYDYRISRAVGTVNAWFYADFYVGNPGYRASEITNIYAPGVSGFGATENPNSEIVRSIEDTSLSRAALARSYWFSQTTLTFDWKAVGGQTTVGSSCELWLACVNGHFYVDSKLPY